MQLSNYLLIDCEFYRSLIKELFSCLQVMLQLQLISLQLNAGIEVVVIYIIVFNLEIASGNYS